MTDPGKAKAKSHLTEKEWAKAEALYRAGGTTLEKLAAELGVQRSTVTRRFAKRGVKKGEAAADIHRKAQEAAAAKQAEEIAVVAARIRETKEESYKMEQGIARLIWQEILDAKKDGIPIATKAANIKALKDAAQGIGITRAERYTLLGLDKPDAVDPDELPELEITELQQSEIEELRARDLEFDEAASAATSAADPDADSDEDLDGDDDDDGVVVTG